MPNHPLPLPQAIMMAPARSVLLLVDAQLVNAGTIESGGDERVGGIRVHNRWLLLRLRGERAKAQQRQKDASQDNKQAD